MHKVIDLKTGRRVFRGTLIQCYTYRVKHDNGYLIIETEGE